MDQSELLDEMLANKIEAIIIKVAALGWCIKMIHFFDFSQYLKKINFNISTSFLSTDYISFVFVYVDVRSG